ncbi:MAG: NAD(P)-dependent oxidoreductase [Pseudomonadota bacterium]
MARRVLVTGATGFVGRQTLLPLKVEGVEIVALTTKTPSDPVDGVTYIECDLTDLQVLQETVAQIAATDLMHLAWRPIRSGLWGTPENLRWLELTLKLVEAFADAGGKRVLATGSSGDYSWEAGLCHETRTPLQPTTVYGQVKVAVFHAVSAICETRGIEFVWPRLFFLYGPGEHPSRLAASVAISVLRNEPAMCSHGMQLRDYMHVADAGRGLASLMTSDLTGPFNLATGEAVRVKDVILGIAEAAGRVDLVKLGARDAPAFEPPLIVADMSKLNDTNLAWAPRFDLASGTRDTLEWYRAQSVTLYDP